MTGTESTNTQVLLRELPDGPISVDHFSVIEGSRPACAPGGVVTRTLYLSIDPVMRKRMRSALEGKGPSPVGQVMTGRTVGVVEESDDPRYAPGDVVVGWGGWQRYALEDPEHLTLIDDPDVHPSAYLSVLGRPGITAWLGIVHTATVGTGDTVIVSSAAGAVGSVAAQLAKARGARVVGIAGGAEKCAWLTENCGLDASVDYKSEEFVAQLEAATPDGATVVFESVGGRVFDESLARMSSEGRIALCGLLDGYQSSRPHAYRNFSLLLERGLTLTGFRIDALTEHHPAALDELSRWLDEGRILAQESVTQGLKDAPQGFVDMLAGRGFGKHLIQV